MMTVPAYREHLSSSNGLVTTYEATRAGFVMLALEKNRRATPHISDARALQEAASRARMPADLLDIKGIEAGLLTAAGLSDKALTHLLLEDRIEAIQGLIRNFLEPAGAKFVEELVFRFLLTRGDTLGGSMRNVGGVLAQRKLTRAILSTLRIAGVRCRWQDARTRRWSDLADDDPDAEFSLRGIHWKTGDLSRTLIYNLTVTLVGSNVDLCLFEGAPGDLEKARYTSPSDYLALGELKGGIDPSGADEHWKTAGTALERVRRAFAEAGYAPKTFFIGAAIERRMAEEVWSQLESSLLANAANLNEVQQLASLSRWLCAL